MQLDFIGSIFGSFSQLSFEDARKPITIEVEKFFHSITKDEINIHSDYWSAITPESSEEIFKRYLFAFLSVHTSYENNVKAYLDLKDWYKWINNEKLLLDKLIESGVGLHNNRVKYLSKFCHQFWANTSDFKRNKNESWINCRNRIEKNILGLGLAKTSFSLEMIYPLESGVVCLDTHLFQFYKLNQSKDHKKYFEIEDHWFIWSKMFNIPCFIARAIYWNRKQNKNNCDYWAYVFSN